MGIPQISNDKRATAQAWAVAASVTTGLVSVAALWVAWLTDSSLAFRLAGAKPLTMSELPPIIGGIVALLAASACIVLGHYGKRLLRGSHEGTGPATATLILGYGMLGVTVVSFLLQFCPDGLPRIRASRDV